MPTIGIEARSLMGEVTGVGRYLRNLLREMAGLDPDLSLRLYLDREGRDGLEDLPRVERRALPGRRGMNVFRWTHQALPRMLRREPVPLVHFPFYTLPFRLHCPAVVTIHDITFSLHPEWFPWRSRIAFTAVAPGSARRAAHVLTVSECSRRDLVERYALDPARVTAVPLAADPAFRPRAAGEVAEVGRRYGLRSPYLIHLGSLHPRRNLERLLDALAGLGRESGEVTLALAGRVERPYRSVEPLIRSRGLRDRVLHLGYAPDRDLPALVSGARALVYPSLYEGFGLPILEAMACGTPVLTSNVSALPETAGDAALLVDPRSTEEIARGIRSLLGDDRLRERLRRAGLERAGRFSWRRTAEATLRVYRLALSSSNGGAGAGSAGERPGRA